MPELYPLDRIKNVLSSIDPVVAIEEGFVKYSEGRVMVPPVGELLFDDLPGDMHIKYGRIIDDELYVVKSGLNV